MTDGESEQEPRSPRLLEVPGLATPQETEPAIPSQPDQPASDPEHRPIRVIEFRRTEPAPDGSSNGEANSKIAMGALMVTLCGLCSAGVLLSSRHAEGEDVAMVAVFGGGPILIGIILILRGIAERNL